MVPCRSRGYQPRGTIMVRPSSRSTASSLRDTFTSTAWAWSSLVEILIPTPHQFLLVCFDDSLNVIQLISFEPFIALKSGRRQPEFRPAIIAFHMNMRRLIPVACIEEKPLRTVPQNG